MKKLTTILLVCAGLMLMFLEACETPVEDTTDADQFREDSLAQASIDSLIILDYISDNGYNPGDVVAIEQGIRYLISNPSGDTKTYNANDLVSLNITRMFENNQIFTTTNGSLAIDTDSLAWVERWNNEAGSGIAQSFDNDFLLVGSSPQDTIFTEGNSIEVILTDLSNTKEPLDYTLYTNDNPYIPIVINYTENGGGLNSSWPLGFRRGLTEAMKNMRLSSSVLIMCPSAVLFGVTGTGPIPPNTVVIYDVDIVNIRP